MKILMKISVVAIAVLFLAAAMTPAEAKCGSAPTITTVWDAYGDSSWIWSPVTFYNVYYYPAPGYPPYNYDTTVLPYSPAFKGTFWALGAGDVSVPLGDDAGTFTFPENPWLYAPTTYYHATYGGYYSAAILTNWGADAQIDGCIQNTAAGTCTCVLLTDEDGSDGYFAMVADWAGPADFWVSDLTQTYTNDTSGNWGPIILRPMPKPSITNSARKSGSNDLDMTVTVPALSGPADGIYQVGTSCECGPTNFKVYQKILPRPSVAPSVRDIAGGGWTAMNLVGGAAHAGTALGSSVVVESLCGASNTDVWVAAVLEFDSGFSTPITSAQTTRVECGPTLAEPTRPRVRPGDIQPPRKPSRSGR